MGPGARIVPTGSGKAGAPSPEEKALNRTLEIAPVRKSVIVDASPVQAFEAFTLGIDGWWPKSHSIGASPMRATIIEPFVGGRWYSSCEDGSQVTVGHVSVWEPGARLVFSRAINAQWHADARIAYTSEVEVVFVPQGAGRTGWSSSTVDSSA
jgi:hypothetical protein